MLWAEVCHNTKYFQSTISQYVINLELTFLFQLCFCLQLDIEYDKFIRTTDPKHEAVVNDFYSRVLSSGDIYRADYEGLYCVSCEEYKASFFVPSHIEALVHFLGKCIYTCMNG